MKTSIDPYLTRPDVVVLESLFRDVKGDLRRESAAAVEGESQAKDSIDPKTTGEDEADKESIAVLQANNDPHDANFTPTVFTTWDEKDLPDFLNRHVLKPWTRIATNIVRHPTDVVFLNHLIQYLTINLGSAIWLYHHFTYLHAIGHTVYTVWCAGSFTLLMHNHIHNNGILSKHWAWLDRSFPYVLEPLMGHTWDSYYYHHVKHHHVEGNGPDDLSSTIRYQRDDVFHFLHYYARFLLFIWAELPLYFFRKGQMKMGLRAFFSEIASYAFLGTMTWLNPRASVFVLLIPFAILRFALMVGNWGQHALVDEVDPDSDFRSSITLIDVSSNRFCFNDGYHTAHHLNPRRHWREHPVHFLQSKAAYRDGRALVFHDIDYLMMTIQLLRKDYLYLAARLVPMGEQIGMSQVEIAEMLRRKTRAFTEEEIRRKFK